MRVVGGDTSGEEAVADENPCVVAPLHDVQGGTDGEQDEEEHEVAHEQPSAHQVRRFACHWGSHWKCGKIRQSAVL